MPLDGDLAPPFVCADFALYDAHGARSAAAGTASDPQCTAGAAESNATLRYVSGDDNSIDVAGFSTVQADGATLGTVNDTRNEPPAVTPQGGTAGSVWFPEGAAAVTR